MSRRRYGHIPVLDVLLLVLLFFMLSAQFSLTAKPPISIGVASSTATSRLEPMIVVAQNATILGNQEMTMPALLADLARRDARPEAPVYVKAGPDAKFQAVVEVLDKLRESGFSNLIFVE